MGVKASSFAPTKADLLAFSSHNDNLLQFGALSSATEQKGRMLHTAPHRTTPDAPDSLHAVAVSIPCRVSVLSNVPSWTHWSSESPACHGQRGGMAKEWVAEEWRYNRQTATRQSLQPSSNLLPGSTMPISGSSLARTISPLPSTYTLPRFSSQALYRYGYPNGSFGVASPSASEMTIWITIDGTHIALLWPSRAQHLPVRYHCCSQDRLL